MTPPPPSIILSRVGHCTLLHCTVLYLSVLYCTLQQCILRYCTSAVLYSTTLFCTPLRWPYPLPPHARWRDISPFNPFISHTEPIGPSCGWLWCQGKTARWARMLAFISDPEPIGPWLWLDPVLWLADKQLAGGGWSDLFKQLAHCECSVHLVLTQIWSWKRWFFDVIFH